MRAARVADRDPAAGAGNEWLHREGAAILSPCRKHLAIAQTVEDWDFDFPSSPSGAIPTYVFASERTVHLNVATLALKHYGLAATTDKTIIIPGHGQPVGN